MSDEVREFTRFAPRAGEVNWLRSNTRVRVRHEGGWSQTLTVFVENGSRLEITRRVPAYLPGRSLRAR